MFTLDFAEVTTYSSAIRTARGFVSDVGESVASAAGGVLELSRCRGDHPERDGHRVLVKSFKLGIPIPLIQIPKRPGVKFTGEICMLRLKDWLKYLIKMNCWHILCGLVNPNPERERDLLTEFWRRYKLLYPGHQLWDIIEREKIDVSRLAPMLLHGDEGRGRRKSPFLVLAWHSILGRGTVSANLNRKRRPYLSFKLNYVGSPHSHIFLTGVLPKMFRDQIAFTDLMNKVADDILDMTFQGIPDTAGNVYRAVCLQVCGDWQFLQKAGHLTRSYSNCEKRPRAANSIPKGICHRCRAGQLHVPFEDYRTNVVPWWRGTMFSQDPFQPGNPPPMLRVPHLTGKGPALFSYDLWHCYHLGVGKTFLASCIAIMSDCMYSSNIEGRFEELTTSWLTYCSEMKKTVSLQSITKDGISWADRGQYPNGLWSKGHITTSLGDWIQHWLEHYNEISEHRMLQECLVAVRAIGHCMRKMYSSDVFLTISEGTEVADAGLAFLSSYQKLAVMAYQEQKNLFAYMPKGHALAEVFWDLKGQTQIPGNSFCISPLTMAVQIDEDYIGRTCRLSRRVSSQQSIRRTLERALLACYKHWVAAGFIRQG